MKPANRRAQSCPIVRLSAGHDGATRLCIASCAVMKRPVYAKMSAAKTAAKCTPDAAATSRHSAWRSSKAHAAMMHVAIPMPVHAKSGLDAHAGSGGATSGRPGAGQQLIERASGRLELALGNSPWHDVATAAHTRRPVVQGPLDASSQAKVDSLTWHRQRGRALSATPGPCFAEPMSKPAGAPLAMATQKRCANPACTTAQSNKVRMPRVTHASPIPLSP